MRHLDDRRAHLLSVLGAGLVVVAITWPLYSSAVAVPVVIGVLGAVMLLVVLTSKSPKGSSAVSSFIKLAKGAKMPNAKIKENESEADTFIEVGEGAEVEEPEIERNVHKPRASG